MSRDRKGRFVTGNNGGPGRPRGSRNLLSEEFLTAVYQDWTKNGKAVLAKVRSNNPTGYLRVVASLVPRDIHVQSTTSDFDKLTDAQLLELLKNELHSLKLSGDGED
jgi:hypothetical protein